MNVKPKTMFTGDNLPIMRGMDTESVDLIYLDPPFNSKKQWTAPIGSKAAGAAFKDAWTLSDIDVADLGILAEERPKLSSLINSIGDVNGSGDKSYLLMMASRLIEMQRILKPTGSIYLHCDPTMSHSLKLLMDEVLGGNNFMNEIIWQRHPVHDLSNSAFDDVADVILFYSYDKSQMLFNKVYGDFGILENKFKFIESETGRRFQHVALEQQSNKSSAGESRKIGDREVKSSLGWRWTQETFDKRLAENPYLIYWTQSGKPRYKKYADEYAGKPLGNIWTDIFLSSGSSERTGYPTQKPLALLQRIVKASSEEGDVVLDPFCGCATACLAAESLDRNWIGIDLSSKAIELVKQRFANELGLFNPNIIHRTDIPIRSDGVVRSKDIKHILYGKQEGNCNGCKSYFAFRHFEVDHIIPKASGGPDDDSNLQLLCGNCNRIKGDRSMGYLIESLKALGVVS